MAIFRLIVKNHHLTELIFSLIVAKSSFFPRFFFLVVANPDLTRLLQTLFSMTIFPSHLSNSSFSINIFPLFIAGLHLAQVLNMWIPYRSNTRSL